MQFEELVIPVGWGEIRGRRYQRGGAAHVLALHGWMDNCLTFEPLLTCLDVDAEIVCIDFPGHGWSDHRPPGCAYHFVDWLGDIDDVLAALKWDSVWLLGHSMGATAASIYASISSTRVEGLLLIDAIAQLPDAPEGPHERLRQSLHARRELKSYEHKPRASIDEFVRKRLELTPMPEEIARTVIERSVRKREDGFELRSDRRLKYHAPVRMTVDQTVSLLSHIKCPTLVIRGEPGLAFPTEAWDQFVAAIPNLTVIKMDGHHYLHIDRADEIAQHISRFCRERSVNR